MSKADEMFEEIGLHKYIDNENTILYRQEKEGFKTIIFFRKDIQTFYTYCERFIPQNIETWRTQEFKNEWLRYCSTQGHWEKTDNDIGMNLLKIINLKCKELGWLDE